MAKDVCAILATEATGTLIEWKIDAEGAIKPHQKRYGTMKYISHSLIFCLRLPQQAVISLWIRLLEKPMNSFSHSKGSVYTGKYCYAQTGSELSFFSAHTPLKPKLSCE